MQIARIDVPDGDGSFYIHYGYGPDREIALERAVRRFVVEERHNWIGNACTPDEVAPVVAMGEALAAGEYERIVELADDLGIAIFVSERIYKPVTDDAFAKVVEELRTLEPVDSS